MKILKVGAEMFPADGRSGERTGRHDNANASKTLRVE